MSKVLDVEVLDDPRGLRPDVPELVDQNAWYVTVAPVIVVPSVYVVTAFQERVSACATAAAAPMASRKTNSMVIAFLPIFPPTEIE
ncbi:MAG: hypothetical protein R3239_01915 [Thermodesulfobacteriota bacterium]|nr:hypothetical protein [Thermodesulfobacteriota bacterium]